MVLEPAFRELFTEDELRKARKRLEEHGYTPQELSSGPTPVSPALRALLERVDGEQDQFARWALRNEVVAYGPSAREAMREWLAREHLAPFAISALEHLAPVDPAAARVIDAYIVAGGRERGLAVAALDRLRTTSRSASKVASRARTDV